MWLTLLQLNCVKATAVKHDFGKHKHEHSGITMLQDPADKLMFTTRGSAKMAIIINDARLDYGCVESFTHELDMCALFTRFGSLYCPPTDDLEQYIAYLTAVVPRRIPLILGMNTNTVSPIWHSKISHRTIRATILYVGKRHCLQHLRQCTILSIGTSC